MIALGITIVLIGALATWYVTTTTSRTVSVLTISDAVQRGEAITQNDLTTISIAGGQNVDAIPASEASDIVGQVAAVDLPAGSLLTTSNIIDKATQTLELGQLPSRELLDKLAEVGFKESELTPYAGEASA